MRALKKHIPRIVLVFVGGVAGMALAFVLYAATGGALFDGITGGQGNKKDTSGSGVSDAELTNMAFNILEDIKKEDYAGLSRAAHPDYGVVFSPYATITLSSSKCFSAEQIAKFDDDTNVYVWGVYDGSGDLIEMTPPEYFARFVFDKDYTAPDVIGIDHIVKSGNALENIHEIFPDARFVDFHIPSGNNDIEDIGWSSLRLSFEEYDGKLRLTAVVHSEWTS